MDPGKSLDLTSSRQSMVGLYTSISNIMRLAIVEGLSAKNRGNVLDASPFVKLYGRVLEGEASSAWCNNKLI